jgi:hypothetical protein
MKTLFQGMIEGIMLHMKREDALRVLREAQTNCETPEQRSLILTAIQRVEEGMPAPSTMCWCGHAAKDHIYEEGACRPGEACQCEQFHPRGQP